MLPRCDFYRTAAANVGTEVVQCTADATHRERHCNADGSYVEYERCNDHCRCHHEDVLEVADYTSAPV